MDRIRSLDLIVPLLFRLEQRHCREDLKTSGRLKNVTIGTKNARRFVKVYRETDGPHTFLQMDSSPLLPLAMGRAKIVRENVT